MICAITGSHGIPKGLNRIGNNEECLAKVRKSIDDAKLMRAIVESGYTGYIGQEFVPKRPDAMKSLAEAVAICDV